MSWDINEPLCRKWADSLIERHNKKRFDEPCSFDVYDLIDIVGAKLAIEYLTPERKYLGATIFKDATLWIWPDNPYFNGMLPTRKFFKEGTIIIDKDLVNSELDTDIKIANFTFLHEIFHFEKHKDVIDEKYHITQQNNMYGNKLEQEANYGASLFLMPERAVKNVFMEEFVLHETPRYPLPFYYSTKPVIQKMAQIFGVNYSPMVYRLQELSLINKSWERW